MNLKNYLSKEGFKRLFTSRGAEGGKKHPVRRKVLIGIAAVILVLLIIAIIAPFVIDLNKYKGPILARLRPALNRNVDFESINLTVLTGIGAEINGLTIPENPQFATGSFVSVEHAKARLQILPLLSGNIRIAKIVFKSPVVHVRRNEQGVFNFADMTGKKEVKPKAKVPAILASLGINELAIRDGTVTYEDRKVSSSPGKAPKPIKKISVSMLDATIENISLSDTISISARGDLFGGPERNFSVSGELGPVGMDLDFKNMPVDLAINIDSLPMRGLTEGLGLPFTAFSGAMSGEINAKGSLKQRLDAASKITVKDLVMQKRTGPAPKQKPAPASGELSGKVAFDAAGQEVVVEDGKLTINGSSFAILGKAQHIFTVPAWNFSVRSVSLEPASLASVASMFGVSLPAGLTLRGPAKIELSTAGTSQDIAIESAIDMSTTEISLGQKFHKPAGLAFTLASGADMQQKILNIRSLNLNLYNLALAGSGTVNTKEKVPAVNLQFASKPVALQGWDALIPMLKNYRLGGSIAMKAGVTGTTKEPSFKFQGSSEQLGFTLPPDRTKGKDAKETNAVFRGMNLSVDGKMAEKKLSALGTLGIESGSFSNIALSKMATQFRYTPQQIDIQTFRLGVFGGTVNGSGSYIPALKDWTFNPVFKGLNAGQAMNTLTSFKEIFSGTLSGDMQIRGNTAVKGAGSLTTKGTIAINQGKMNNLDLITSAIDGLTGIPGLSGLLNTQQGAVQRNKETSFDSLTASFSMAQKVLEIRPLKLTNIRTGKETNSIATLEGTVDMTTKRLGLNGNVALSPDYSARLSSRTPALAALQNNQKRVVIPISITGTTTRPLVTPQVSEISKAVTDYYARKGIEKGLEGLRKKLNIPNDAKGDSDNSNKGKSNTRDKIDDLLNGVLGK